MLQLTASGLTGDPGERVRSRAVVALNRDHARVPTQHHNTTGVHVQIPILQHRPAILIIVQVSVIFID